MNISQIENKKNNDYLSIKNQRWVIVIVTVILTGFFIGIAYLSEKPGFPLDDSWIHQTYARNLALTGRWEYMPGVLSAGSTSPLWTMLLSIGYFLGWKSPFLWTSLLSVSISVGLVLVVYEIIKKIEGGNNNLALFGSILIILDWHMLWSSGSGMETMLYCLICTLIFLLLLSDKNWLWVSILSGLVVWIRPDGITLYGPILVIFGWKLIRKQVKVIQLLSLFLPFIFLLFLYIWFNYSISGRIFPNTFYAKQIEYSVVLSLPLWKRLGSIFSIPVTGVGLFLIPGFIRSVRNAILKRNLWLGSMILWFMGYGFLFACKLPMVYQHGRYLFPLIPVFFVIGFHGTCDLFSLISENRARLKRIVKFQTFFCITACAALFAWIGEDAFKHDLKTINHYMVEPALWIEKNTPVDSIIAVHDIGAMGYFGERKLIDLAGLVQPEIIPIIRNENKLKEYLIEENADYLVVFKDWYKDLDNLGSLIVSFEPQDKKLSEVLEIRKIK